MRAFKQFRIKKKAILSSLLILLCTTLMISESTINVDAAKKVNPLEQSEYYSLLLNTKYNEIGSFDSIDFIKAIKDAGGKIDVSNVGAFFGPLSTSSSSESSGTTTGVITANSNSSSKVDFTALTDGDEFSNAALAYFRYGYALKVLNLDNTDNNAFAVSAIDSGALKVALWLVDFAENLSGLTKKVIGALQYLNPLFLFGMMSQGLYGYALNHSNIPPALVTAFSGLASFMKTIGNVSVQIVIPALIMFCLYSYFVRKKLQDYSSSGNIKAVIYKIVWILIGFPVLLGAYSNALSTLQESVTDSENEESIDLYDQMAMNFVDFNTWATKYGLGLPSGYGVIVESDAVTTDGNIKRRGVYVVKGKNNSDTISTTEVSSTVEDILDGTYSQITSSGDEEYINQTNLTRQLALAINKKVGSYDPSADKKIKRQQIETLLQGYIDGDTVEPANIASSKTAKLSTANYVNSYSTLAADGNTAVVDTWSDTVFSGGGLTTDITDSVNTQVSYIHMSPSTAKGLSTAALYNYLRTDFGTDSATLNATSNTTQYSVVHHRAVVQSGGSGSMWELFFDIAKSILTSVLVLILHVLLFYIIIQKMALAVASGFGSLFGIRSQIVKTIGYFLNSFIDIFVMYVILSAVVTFASAVSGLIETIFT